MISDNNGNLLLVGSPEIRIPERMFFMAKNGKVREAPTTTKSGALSMRGGVRSINLIPSGDKVEVFKLGETLEEFRKRQSKKESNDLLNEMMNTKISKKIEMPEMPEPKVKKVKAKEPEPKKEKLYLDEILKIKKNFKELIDSEVLKNKYNSKYSIDELKARYYKFKNKIKSIIEEMEINGFDVNEESSKLVKSGIIYMNIINKIESNRRYDKIESKPEQEQEQEQESNRF
jgi:hypothetical protein